MLMTTKECTHHYLPIGHGFISRRIVKLAPGVRASRFYFALFAFFLLMHSAQAAIPGLPDKTIRYGLAIGALHMAADNPEGLNPDPQSVIPVNFIMTDWLPNGTRYWLDLLFTEAAYTASPNQIGQNVRYTSLRSLLQKNLKLTSTIRPWLGMGLEFSYTTYGARHTKASDGFLLEKFDDRSEFNIGVVFNLTTDWELKNHWFLGMKFEQLFNLENNINARGASAYLLYIL